MAKRFDFSSELENNDASSYIDASQDCEHAVSVLRDTIEALNQATADVKATTSAITDVTKQTKALQKLIKELDKKTVQLDKAATLKFSPTALESITECFNLRLRELDKRLADRSSSIIDDIRSKTRDIVDEINTKDRRIAMPRADFWLSRILNLIPLASLLRLLWIDTKSGITSDSLWTTCWWAFGVYLIIVVGYFIFRASREK